MGHIDFSLGVLVQVMHDVDTIATARALITHLGIDGADETLKNNEVRGAPDGYLVKVLQALIRIKLTEWLEKMSTHVKSLRRMVRIILMYFITGMGITKCGNKSSISGFEANVRGDPADSVV